MAFEPIFEKVVTSTRKRVDTLQSQVDCKMPTQDEVKRILCSNAKVNISNVEINGKEVAYSGFVNFQVIYINENNDPVSMDYSAEFKEKYLANKELINVVPVVTSTIVDVNTTVNGDIRVVAVLETQIDMIVNNSINVLSNVSGVNYFVKKDTINYSNYVNTAIDRFDVINDVEIKDGVSKVLSVCPSVFVDSIDVGEKYLTLKGNVYFNICYLTDNNIIRSLDSNFDFVQEIAHDEITSLSKIQSNLQPLFNDIKVTTNIDTDSAIVNIVLPMEFNGYIFNSISSEVVGDLYSTDYYTNINVESIETISDFESVIFSEKLSGNVQIKENDAFIDEVLGTCCSGIVVANSMVADGVFSVEGVATISVMYLNKETSQTYTVEVEIPFAISTAIESKDGVSGDLVLSLTNITARARRGKEIEVGANLEVYSDVFNNHASAVITNVIEEDEIPENECSMSFYLVKENDDIWSIAKNARVSSDVLISQNPGLVDELTPNKRVVVYRQKQMEF